MATNEDNGWFGNLKNASRAKAEEFNQEYGSKPGQVGRTARRFTEGWKDAGSKAAALGGALVDTGDEYIGQPIARGIQTNIKSFEESGEPQTTPQSQEFKSFNDGFVTRNFPEIADKYGSSGVQIELQRNKIGAVEGAITGAGSAIQEMKDQGFSRQQIEDQAKKRTQDPQELGLVNSELDAAFGVDKNKTGPVSDTNIQAVADKVAAARNGADPTIGTISSELEAKTKLDEGAIYSQAIDATSEALHAKHITPQNWYESQSFNSSLIRFGLGLLSGEDYATAFSNAAGDYERLSGREKRQAYADELVNEGYDQASVMQWIDDGKANILTKPTAKSQEKWSYKSDDTGAYQESSLTGKRDYRPAAKAAAGLKTQVVDVDGEKVLFNSQTGERIKTLGGIPTKGGKGGKGGLGSSEGVSGLHSPFGGDPFTLPSAGTADERRSGTRGQRAVEAAGGVAGALSATRQELADSKFTSPGIYEGHLANIMAEADSTSGTYAIEALKKQYPALTQYAAVMNATLNAVMRDDSGAAIGNAEQKKYLASLAPRPTDNPEVSTIKQKQMDSAILNITSSGNSRVYQALSDLKAGVVSNVIITSQGPVVIDNEGNPYLVEQVYQKNPDLLKKNEE